MVGKTLPGPVPGYLDPTSTPSHQEGIMPSRDATTHWEGDLQSGTGHVTLDSSNAGQFDVSFPTRAGNPDGQTSPEELIAAAHSACLAMNLSGVLASHELTADSIDVGAQVTLGPAKGGGFEISGVAITLRAKVPGIGADMFAELAATAERTCPVSKALAGTTITLDAALD
jgi:lipoyl-dependent peroxiredoxin